MSTRTGVTFVSQCTFWCSVLSDLTAGTVGKLVSGLNAPFGAQCFPTRRDVEGRARTPGVSMHLLVLSAFRPGRVYREACILTRLNAPFGAQCFPTGRRVLCRGRGGSLNAPFGAQCFPTTFFQSFRFVSAPGVSMHLLVLSAFRHTGRQLHQRHCRWSQCTFWCSVLSDFTTRDVWKCLRFLVSMHLLVLSAFRQAITRILLPQAARVSMHLLVLSAFRRKADFLVVEMSGESQCTFWCSVLSDNERNGDELQRIRVSMHLLVLSAFRRKNKSLPLFTNQSLNAPFGAQCFPTPASRKPRRNAVSRDENAADLESTKSNRLAPLQLNHTTPENRHKSTQRRQHPLPIGTPPAFNEPTPKDRSLATPPR